MVRAVFSTSATLISANSTTSGDPSVLGVKFNSKQELSRQKEIRD